MTDTPMGLVILQGARGYIAARDWPLPDGSTAEEAGIAPFAEGLSQDQQEEFRQLLGASEGIALEDVAQHVVLTDDAGAEAPSFPGMTIFRAAADGPFFVARDMRPMISMPNEPREGVFVIGANSDALLSRFHELYPAYFQGDESGVIDEATLNSADLLPAAGAVTITKEFQEGNNAAASASYGSSASFGSSASMGD